MNPPNSPETVLKSTLPILLVLIVLIAGVIIMPTITADPRSRASEPKPVVTPATTTPRPTFVPQSNSIKPEIACSELYTPVCDTVKNITYPSECEAKNAGAMTTTKGECKTVKTVTVPRVTVSPSPALSLPTSN